MKLLSLLKNAKVIALDTAPFIYFIEENPTHKLKIPDAIQLATGLMNGADAFITNDDSFKKVGQIEVIVLNEFI